MKQFLRHIFLLLALFMATASAWAECYILNSPTEIKIEWENADTNKNGNYSSEYSFDGPCAQLTFKYRLDAITDASNWHKITVMGLNNDNQWIELGNTGEIFNAGTKTAMFDLSSYANKISAIKFKRTANSGGFLGANNGKKDVLIREITIKRYTSIAASSIDPFPETKLESETASQNVTVTYSNIGNNYSIIQENTTDFSIEKLPFDYSSCGGEMYFKITFHPKGNVAGVRTGSVTIAGNGDGKSNDNTSVKINLTGKATGEPEHRWDGKTAFLVDETVDLSTWYSSNKDGARTYEIVSFSPDDETGVTPTLNGTTIKLTRAGKLTVRMKQDAHDIYSYKESTQTFKISKYDSNFQWNNPDNLQCYVDDYCNEAALFSRASDLPLTITSSNPNVVSYQDGTFTAVGAGTAVITVKQDKHYKWTDFTQTYTIHVNKYDVSASIAQESAAWNELIYNAFSVSYGLQDYTVTSSNTNIAQYLNGNKIQTYFTSGTVQFRIFRAEDRKYKELNLTLELIVQAAGGCDVLNATEEVSLEYSVLWEERIYEPTSFTGIPNELTFYTYKTAGTAVGDIEVQQYVNNRWIAVKDHSNNDVIIDATTSYKKYGPYTLDESATKMRFYNGYGSYKRYFKNVQVTRKAYLRPSTIELTLPQTNIGKSSENTFNLSWSTCSDDIKLVSNNDLFELGTTQINSTAHTGTTNNILVRFKGANEPGTYSAVITIYDQSQSKEVHVSCVVKDRLATTIVYTGETQYSEAQDCIEGKFSVVDENGNTVTREDIDLISYNEDILSICGNAGFMPHCGGKVTLTAKYAGDETYAPAEWSREITVANCYQTIDWEQDFRQFIAAEDGTISQRIELTAKAVPTDFAITYELDGAAQKFARLENQNGQWFLVIFGVGTGHIMATSPAGTFETKYYDEASLMHEIRVHKWGEKCNTDEILTTHEVTLSEVLMWLPTEKVFTLEGRPYARLEFYSHVSNESFNNDLTISFSTDGGSTWTNSKTFNDIPKKYDWSTPYVHDNIPEGANRVKFRTNSTTNTYFNMVKMVQKTYLEPNVTEIRIDDAIVNQQFSREFKVKYSDIPLLQHVISDSYDLGLKLTSMPPVANDCGDWGEYTFILTGESPYPQEIVTETITFYTSAGDVVKIPVTITATLSEPFYFNVTENGDWKNPTNWTHKKSTNHGMIPDKRFPIVISKTLTINEGKLVAYGITIEEGSSVNIQPTGGLTLHAGGFAGVNENNFEVHNNKEGAGYVRVSKYFKKRGGTMPKMKVHFTTKATLNEGGKAAAWQYIGAPGDEVLMPLEATTVLYLRSEESGWVRKWSPSADLEPFAGYALTQKVQENFVFTPRLVTEDRDIKLTYTDGGMKGDNLWANSYMAPIDIKKIGDEDFSGNIDKVVYLYNSGSWDQWNQNHDAISSAEVQPGRYYAIPVGSARALDAAYDQTVIPPMQGVYMKAKSGGGTLRLKYDKHVWNCTTTGEGMFDNMNSPLRVGARDNVQDDYLANILRVRLQVNSENSGADRMYVIEDSTCTADYDNGYDAPKQIVDGLMNIYTNESFGKMEISSTDHMDGMFIGFQAGEDDVYTMTFTSLIGDNLYLYDVEQDTLVDMSNGKKYAFAAAAKSTNDMRFQILVNPDLNDYQPGDNGGGVTTDIHDVHAQQLWVHDEKVYIAHASSNSILEVYAVSGMAVARYEIGYAPCTLDLSNMPIGVYMLRLNDQVYKFVCK